MICNLIINHFFHTNKIVLLKSLFNKSCTRWCMTRLKYKRFYQILSYDSFFLDNVCLRPWAFERVPNKMIRGLDNALIYTSTKEACLAACLNEVRTFVVYYRYCFISNVINKHHLKRSIRTYKHIQLNWCD